MRSYYETSGTKFEDSMGESGGRRGAVTYVSGSRRARIGKPRGVAIRGYTDNKSNESLLRKAMTTKYPSMLVLMETAEELSHRNCELQLQWIRRDLNQLADPTNEEFKSFDTGLRIVLKGDEFRWRILDRLLAHSDSFYKELGVRKRETPARVSRFGRKVRKLNPW